MRSIASIFLILCVLIIFSCKSTKNYPKSMKMPKPVMDDSLSHDMDGVVDYQDVEVDSLESSYSKGYYIAESRSYKLPKSKKTTVVDKTTVTEKRNYIKGLIAYSVPDEMSVGEDYSIKIRISKDTTEKKTLIVGDTKIHIADTSIQSTVTIESIRVSSIMSASLTSNDEDNFKITSKSTETQNIEEFGYTEWEWNVMPLKSGNNQLKLIIKVRITTEDGEKSFKDIVVFEKDILTKNNISYSTKNLVDKYWQWALSTLILPFLIWLYNRKKKKKE